MQHLSDEQVLELAKPYPHPHPHPNPCPNPNPNPYANPNPNRNPNPDPNLSDEQVSEYVRQFDRSGDGLLSLSEFAKLVAASAAAVTDVALALTL